MLLAPVLEYLCLPSEIINNFSRLNIVTVLDFLSCNHVDLAKNVSLDDHTMESIKEIIYSKHAAGPIYGTFLYDETIRLTQIIPTGCSHLDNLLDGGLFTKELIEIYGTPASGKTQLAYFIASNVISNLHMNMIYIDTNGSFIYDRFKEVLKMNGATLTNLTSVLSRMECHKVFDPYYFIADLEQIKDRLCSQGDDSHLKLVVVDNLPAIITPVLGDQSDGHALLSHIGLLLKEIAFEYGVSIMVINNAVANYFDGAKSNNNKKLTNKKYKPALGISWLPVPSIRLFMDTPTSVAVEDVRSVTLEKHTRLPTNRTISVKISKSGIENFDPSIS